MLSSKLQLYITSRNPFPLFNSYCSSFFTTLIHHLQQNQQFLHNITMTDLTDYKIIKEGEAEILMHAKNEVFYNKAQVNNRDISIAVLRAFISKRKEEHEALLSKRRKGAHKVPENNSSESVTEEEVSQKTAPEDHKSNGEHKVEEEISPEEGEPFSTTEGSVKTTEEFNATEEKINPTEVKVKRELKPPRVLEALSASGLRALRYAREVEGIGQVVALDNDSASVEACRRNIKFNGSVAVSKVESHLADARVYMLTHPNEFDMVDLDPYGSPSVFLDSAVQSVVDGGMLMCTATDMAVLCGGNGEVCYSKYGSYPLRGKYCHEMALRILLASIESHANRYKRYIVPVLSVQMDFYVRVFVRIYTSASAMKNTPLKLSYVYQCTGCDSFHLQPIGRSISKNTSVRYLPGYGPVVPQECTDCGKKFNMGGPIWSAPIHDQEWVASMLADVKSTKARYPAYERISAVLTTISEELPDVPLFLSLHNLCATLKCTSPSAIMFRSAVINAGYRISGTHVNPLGLKSDAPMDVIWDIMRCWVKTHPVKAQTEDLPGSVILAKEPVLQANFTRAVASLSKAQAKKVARFLPNPERHWGPKLRAGRTITSKHVSLLGEAAVNGVLNREDNEEPKSKKPKTDDSITS
ncbi:PREDICTED: probable tRNA (guanine(26)-N(2))-dimethyltransferase 2 [Lupinus angustifolius]|uniref:probable tRNA (guanine(26)-N(2))-dimethyltransferase 2 n=1 Tax=Lupinus angustifolius TaxID=3871 RepID=UPI00092F5D65|nr:PREDICTED: probable tRNA (guanine(26)-N(2))-dimethyltransferase 2 [Lupinus angustifolius]